MSFFDLAIFYLSLGAPSAVYHFIENRDRSSASALLSTIGVFLFWPPKTISILNRQLGRGRSTHSAHRRDLDQIVDYRKSEIFKLIRATASPREMFELRDAVDCYVVLTTAAGDKTCEKTAAIFEIAGRTDTRVASACLMRRNATRLAAHQTGAGTRLRTALKNAALTRSISTEAVAAIAELAGLLGDETTAAHLRGLETGENILNEHEGEKWKSGRELTLIGPSEISFSAATTASIND